MRCLCASPIVSHGMECVRICLCAISSHSRVVVSVIGIQAIFTFLIKHFGNWMYVMCIEMIKWWKYFYGLLQANEMEGWWCISSVCVCVCGACKSILEQKCHIKLTRYRFNNNKDEMFGMLVGFFLSLPSVCVCVGCFVSTSSHTSKGSKSGWEGGDMHDVSE